MIKSLLLLLSATMLLPSLAKAQATVGVPVCGLATDGSTDYIPTDWATFTAPAKGGSYIDNSGGVPFGCRVTRLTNGATDFGSTPYAVTLYYDTVIPFSADDELIMGYQSSGAHYIVQNPYLTGYNGTAVPTSNMPSMNDQAPPMWDRAQPEMFYYTTGTQLRTGTVTGTPGCFATNNCTVTTALVHDFSGTYVGVSMMDETSESVDGHHILLEGNTTSGGAISVFVYDTNAQTSSTPYVTSCSESVTAGPNGSCLHKMQIGGDNNPLIMTANANQEFVWNGTTTICLQGSCGGGSETGHGATGQDLNGNPVWLSLSGSPVLSGQSSPCTAITSNVYQDLAAIPQNNPLSAGTCLLASPSSEPGEGITNWHIGYDGSASQPWAYVTWFQEGPSFYFGNSGSYSAPSTNNWPLYSGEMDLARINANYSTLASSSVIRLVQTRNRSQVQFWAQTFGALSADGLYAVFSSNMAYANSGCPSNEHASGVCGDLYLVSDPSVSSFGTTGAPLFGGGGGAPAPPPPPPVATKPAAPTGLTATVQ
jgi:hypothetical protein